MNSVFILLQRSNRILKHVYLLRHVNLYADRLRPLVITFFIFFILRQGRYGLVLGADLVLDQTLADNHVQSWMFLAGTGARLNDLM